MQEIRYVISDLDDTFLNPHEQITPRTLEAVAALRAAGIGLMLASGRMIASMAPYVRQVELRYPFIACNGAQIADPGTMEPLYEDLLPLPLLREMCLLLERAGCYFQVYYGDRFYFEKTGQYDQAYSRNTGAIGEAVGRLSDFVDRPTPKLLVMGEPAEADAMQRLLTEAFHGRAVITRSKDVYVEVTAISATKGSALTRLLSLLGIPGEQVLAIGDGRNDVAMFDVAGISVAMGGALPEVRSTAAYQTLSNREDGWAHFMCDTLLPAIGERERA